ncbi:MAG: DUF3536 domain-containing protein [Candidatus Tritonobacter lacicola]|nr:DUF3536 domain-containing protein [Candidatus Tritonobacter lacicola]
MENNAHNRFVVLHGHFYQPPRENPWLEAVEKQPGAAPYHNWNERIAYECYLPNANSRIKNVDRNKTIDLVNNYALISFNFGPTLISWYERQFPDGYEWILDADRISRERNNGHGNAVAQIYNHVIMPLTNRRDQVTEVLWGIRDFEQRFKRKPEGMWLSETACNYATVEVLIKFGIKFIILSPTQAERIRKMGGKKWIDVSAGTIDTRRPYRLFLKNREGKTVRGKHIDVFFYNMSLSQAVAFEDVLVDAKYFADRIESHFDPNSNDPQLVSIVTDGESFGHHRSFADMGLAYLLKYELPKRNIHVVNYASYLELNPPDWTVEIKTGRNGEGTSWSCSHGVDRWKNDCGCTTSSRPGWDQKWRAPMRMALDKLRDELARIYEEAGGKIFKDPWTARNDYIDIILDRSPEKIEAFFKSHLKVKPTHDVVVRGLSLLEMQKHSLLMYTSCGWFFAEISGTEAVQNILYAARAIQLARELTGKNLDGLFLPALKEAKSNLREYGDGWGVYEKLVRPSIVSREQLVSHYAISLLLEQKPDSLYCYTFNLLDSFCKELAGIKILAGDLEIVSAPTRETGRMIFLVTQLTDIKIFCYVKKYAGENEYLKFKKSILHLTEEDVLRGEIDEITNFLFWGRSFGLKDLFRDERNRIFNIIIKEKIEKMRSMYSKLLHEYFPIMTGYWKLGMEFPDDLKKDIELALTRNFTSLSGDLKKEIDEEKIFVLEDYLRKTLRYKLNIHWYDFDRNIRSVLKDLCDKVTREKDAKSAKFMKELISLILPLPLSFWRYDTEPKLFYFYRNSVLPDLNRFVKDRRDFLLDLLDTVEMLGFDLGGIRSKIKA